MLGRNRTESFSLRPAGAVSDQELMKTRDVMGVEPRFSWTSSRRPSGGAAADGSTISKMRIVTGGGYSWTGAQVANEQ